MPPGLHLGAGEQGLLQLVFGDGDNWEMRKGVNIVIASGGITIRYEELVDLSDSKHEGR